VKRHLSRLVALFARRGGRGSLDDAGAVAVELGVVIPFLLLIIIFVIDFGSYMNATQAIAAATRVGAEFARDDPNACKTGIDVLKTPQILDACITGIENAMQNAGNFSPALTFPTAPFLTCQCDDGNTITCGDNSCAKAKRPAPNRVFITVGASQRINTIISWPGFPDALTGLTEVRLQ
jgi:hypothetical protein